MQGLQTFRILLDGNVDCLTGSMAAQHVHSCILPCYCQQGKNIRHSCMASLSEMLPPGTTATRAVRSTFSAALPPSLSQNEAGTSPRYGFGQVWSHFQPSCWQTPLLASSRWHQAQKLMQILKVHSWGIWPR